MTNSSVCLALWVCRILHPVFGYFHSSWSSFSCSGVSCYDFHLLGTAFLLVRFPHLFFQSLPILSSSFRSFFPFLSCNFLVSSTSCASFFLLIFERIKFLPLPHSQPLVWNWFMWGWESRGSSSFAIFFPLKYRQPTPGLLPRQSRGQRNLVDYGPWGCKELDTTEATEHTHRSRKSISPIFFFFLILFIFFFAWATWYLLHEMVFLFSGPILHRVES